MNKIDLMIIGTQKSGTSALNKYLASHPGFATHSSLEFSYFVNDEEYKLGYEKSFREHFTEYKKGDIPIAKSVGIIYLSKALERLSIHNPTVKIVITLRNPVDRAYSAYWYAKRMGWENASTFEEGLHQSRQSEHWIGNRFLDYIHRGEYITHIQETLKYFNREQLYFVLAEDLRQQPEQKCNDILAYFGFDHTITLSQAKDYNRAALPRYPLLSKWLLDTNPIKKHLRSLVPVTVGRKIKTNIRNWNEQAFNPPPMNINTRLELIEHFRPFNESLSTLLQRDLAHWNI